MGWFSSLFKSYELESIPIEDLQIGHILWDDEAVIEIKDYPASKEITYRTLASMARSVPYGKFIKIRIK